METPKDPSWLKKDVYEWPSPKGVATSNPDDSWWMRGEGGWNGHLHHHPLDNKEEDTTPLPELALLPELRQEQPEYDAIVEKPWLLRPKNKTLMPVIQEVEDDKANVIKINKFNNKAGVILDELDAQQQQQQQQDPFDFSHLPHIQDNRFIKEDAEHWTPGHHRGCWNFDC